MSTLLQTLRRPVEISGVGLHTGQTVRLKLLPREQTGIVFVRSDLPQMPEIPASWRYIASTHHATTLEQHGISIGTPEHLMAALWSLDVTNCRIEMDAAEVPILDGSATPWCELIQSAALRPLSSKRPEYSLKAPVLIESRDGAVLGLPHSSLRVTVDVEYDVPYLATQVFGGEVSPEIFSKEIAAARTFTLEAWLEPLRNLGLIQGGSLDNALVLAADAPSTPLRFENELARHKAIDLLGDIALLFGEDGGVLRAHLIAIRAGHELHRQWMEAVLQQKVLQCVA